MIRNLEPRLYQETILATCSEKNTLVVLPTGMGKSIVFILLAAQRLTHFPKSKVMILAPTKPLCEQHVNTFKQFMDIEEITLFTGDVKPEERQKLFKESRIIVSTPQGLENDIVSKRISFDDVSLIVFDECHRAVKDYSYSWLAKHYAKTAKYPRILGLTASPGSDVEKIKEICNNLSVEAIEIRTEQDPDVKPYIQDVETEYVEVELSEDLKKIQNYIKDFMKEKGKQIEELGYVKGIKNMSKKELIGIQSTLHGEIARGEKSFDVLKSISMLAEIMKMHHALELLESQGVVALHLYFKKMMEDSIKTKTKAVKNLVMNLNFRSAKILTDKLYEENIEHPKLTKLKEILKLKEGEKAIIFNNFRDNASKLVEELNKLDDIKAELFVGQAKKSGTGLTQKKQIEMLQKFREGKFNVIVMTSVGEEGLDIPKVDKVIFYEPVPSAIRHIQRRGRTGRLEEGKVQILITKGTRDEIYRWSAFHKEKKMYSNLKDLKNKIILEDKEQTKLEDFKGLKIYADHREKLSKTVKELLDRNISLELMQLEVADYIISDDVGIELKTVPDFVNSILDGRLLEQIKDLKYNFKKPLVIIEGEEDLYSIRNIHPNAIRGMLATIAISFGIPIIHTKNFRETTEMLITIAKREQKDESYFTPHTQKRGYSLKDMQEYFISALPNVGLKLAKELLDKFGNPKNIINASEEELKKVDKIGEVKAKKLKEVFENKS
ncbi:DEAD/DEAH box helicase [Candidatus Woesearchaeota archaeon]|nr:DEAD/DEAH box helicase [Candidatus Woesearchaeota archaeon]